MLTRHLGWCEGRVTSIMIAFFSRPAGLIKHMTSHKFIKNLHGKSNIIYTCPAEWEGQSYGVYILFAHARARRNSQSCFSTPGSVASLKDAGGHWSGSEIIWQPTGVALENQESPWTGGVENFDSDGSDFSWEESTRNTIRTAASSYTFQTAACNWLPINR